MLGLKLRQEFLGRRLKGTAIELSNDSKTGATQVAASDFLRITYPTHDLLKGIPYFPLGLNSAKLNFPRHLLMELREVSRGR